MSDTANGDAVWCPADACPVSICGGPHISHVCNGDDVVTMRWDMRCPLCGWVQEKNP